MDEAYLVERRFDLAGAELVARFYAPAKAAGLTAWEPNRSAAER